MQYIRVCAHVLKCHIYVHMCLHIEMACVLKKWIQVFLSYDFVHHLKYIWYMRAFTQTQVQIMKNKKL